MIGSDPLNGGNDLSMTDPGNDVFSTIPPHKLARMGGNPLPVPIRMGKWCSFKGNRKCTRSARSPPAWPWGGYLQPPIFDLQVFSGPRCICYPMAFPGLRISIGSHRVMVGDQKTPHPLHGMPGEYPPIRANLWGGIVLKTPFPGSFMEMSFPPLSGSPPVLDIEKSLHELAEVIPD